MLDFRLNGIPLAEYIPEKGFDIREEKVADHNGFTSYDGSVVGGDTGRIIRLNLKLEKVPFNIAERISSAAELESIPVIFNYPYSLNADFVCESCSATARHKGLIWNISLSLRSKAVTGGNRL